MNRRIVADSQLGGLCVAAEVPFFEQVRLRRFLRISTTSMLIHMIATITLALFAFESHEDDVHEDLVTSFAQETAVLRTSESIGALFTTGVEAKQSISTASVGESAVPSSAIIVPFIEVTPNQVEEAHQRDLDYATVVESMIRGDRRMFLRLPHLHVTGGHASCAAG